jgi:hypothetical protein
VGGGGGGGGGGGYPPPPPPPRHPGGLAALGPRPVHGCGWVAAVAQIDAAEIKEASIAAGEPGGVRQAVTAAQGSPAAARLPRVVGLPCVLR